MKRVLTNAEMRAADRYTIERRGVPSLTLMERAGIALADEAERIFSAGKILVVCGGGNNGGDGFVCARILRERDRVVDVVCHAEKFSVDCAEMQGRWRAAGGTVYASIEDAADGEEKKYTGIVDCLYGTGFHGCLQGKDLATVRSICAMAKRGVKVLAADIPSGVNGDNGRMEGEAVQADVTLCIGELKRGVLLNDGIDYAGCVKRVDIGIELPHEAYAILTDGELAGERLPRRKRNSHKGRYGRAAIVAGSEAYTGAAYLATAAESATSACLRSGAGYTTLFLPKELLSLFALKMPEALLRTTNEGGKYAFNEENMRELLSYSSVAFGMGMGVSEEVYKGARWLISHFTGKLILDADGLNSLARFGKEELPALFAQKGCEILLTPHIKEFSRLSGNSTEEILSDGVALAKAFAKANGVTVLLKNAVSILTDGEEVYLNASGNSGQAKGGSGDVLSGVLAGLSAGGMSLMNTAITGAYLVGKAAEIAAEKVGEYSLLASDIVAEIGAAFLSLSKDADEYGGEE